MPIYEFECDGCHQVFEVRQKFSDAPPTSHSCGSTQVRRILSATSFVLKGTGWYATDYGTRKGDAAKDAAAQKSAAPKKDEGTKSPSAAEAKAPSEAKPKTPNAKSPG